jgi:hypothetical protein
VAAQAQAAVVRMLVTELVVTLATEPEEVLTVQVQVVLRDREDSRPRRHS